MIFLAFRYVFRPIFLFLSGVAKLYSNDPKLLYSDSSDDESDDEPTAAPVVDSEPAPAPAPAPAPEQGKEPPFVRTTIESEWTPENTIKITLNIIVGSNGLGVFLMPNGNQPPSSSPPPRAPTPPPAPIPEPVDDTPTLDDFQVNVDFGRSDAAETNEFEVETAPLRAIPEYCEVYNSDAIKNLQNYGDISETETDPDMPELVDICDEISVD